MTRKRITYMKVTGCGHPAFTFQQIPEGMKRTCIHCGKSIIEAPRGMVTPTKREKRHLVSKMQHIKKRA